MKPKMYAIPAAIVAVCLLFAVVVRFSYTDAGDKVYRYEYGSDANLTKLLQNNKVTAPKDVADQADAVVEAAYTGTRKITRDAFYSQVSVSRVCKGDKSLAGKELCVIEPVSVFVKTQYINGAGSFLVPFQQGERYLLLLKHKQFDPKRKLDDFQKTQYFPVTGSAFGVYRLSAKKQTQLMDENKSYTIASLKGFDLFTSEQTVLDTYNQYKTYLVNRFSSR